MGKRHSTLGLALLVAACSGRGPEGPFAPGGSGGPPRATHPNILLVTLEQVGTRLGTYGAPARTPNLDRLAARGRRFDRAYGQYPSLTPSRLALLLGRRPETTRLWSAPESREALRGAVPLPEASDDPAPGDPGATARRAVEVLAQREDGPFFLAVGFGAPAAEHLPPAAFFRLYDPRSLRLPLEPRLDGLPPLALADHGAGAGLPSPPPSEGLRRRRLAADLAHVSHVDAQVGVLLAALDRHGLTGSTVVVVVDDTAPRGSWPRPDVLFEDALRAALVMAGPGIGAPGRASDRLVELVDVYPTLLDLAGLPKGSGLDGTSLGPLLADPMRPVKEAAVSAVQRVADTLGRSVRTDRWRYTEWPDGSRELYDHDRDPGEFENLALGSRDDATMRELRGLLERGGHAARVTPPPAGARPAALPKPNVLLVMVDDLNVRLGCYGYPVRTPAIDGLAREGRRFDRAYCQVPSCSPSRTSLLTGWRPERTGVWDNLQTPRERLTGAVPLQEHFHANGYFTARVGKIYHGPFEDQFRWDLAEHTPYQAGDGAWEPLPRKEREQAGSAARPWTATK